MHFPNGVDHYKLPSNVHSLRTSGGKALSQSFRSLSAWKQPPFTTYKQWQSTLTIILIIINSEATSIHYVQALAKHSHNGVHDYQLRSNLHSLPTSTGDDTDRIDCESASLVLDSEVTSIDYLQALTKQFPNRFHKYQLRTNLDSICNDRIATLLEALAMHFPNGVNHY